MKIVSVLYTNAVNDNRVQKMAESLQKDGHEVEVVGMLTGNVPATEEVNGIRITRIHVRTGNKPKRSKLAGAFRFLSFAFKVIRKYRKADVWHCNDIEILLVGVMAKIRRPRLKIVYDAHELESERNNIKKWVRRFYFISEKMFTRFAHTVITVSPSIRDFYRKHFKIRNDEVILNCPHLTNFTASDILRKECNISDDKLLFIYLGGFMHGRGIHALLNIFSQLDANRYHIVFMGSGELADEIKSYSQRHSNIHHKTSVPYKRILEYTSGADYGFQSVEPVCLSYVYSLPNKLFECIHAGLPVICNNLKDSREFVENNHIGYGMDKLDIENFNRLLPSLSQQDKINMKSKLEALRLIYNWENEEKKLQAVYRAIAQKIER